MGSITVVGAISLKQVVALMTLNGSMDSNANESLCARVSSASTLVWAVVVMDNLPAHSVTKIEPLLHAVGARLLNLSPYSPDFNPIELWWSLLLAFLRQFSPTTANKVDILLATALDLVNPAHLRNWFANCCYCIS
jgi:transposase